MLPIDWALDDYAFSLKTLDAVKQPKKLRVDQVLSVLVARDEVQRSMGADDCAYSVESVRRLVWVPQQWREEMKLVYAGNFAGLCAVVAVAGVF